MPIAKHRNFRAAAALLALLPACIPSAHSQVGNAAAKPPIHGLVTMGSLNFVNQPGTAPNNGLEELNAHPAVYRAAVVNLLWSQLEPQPGVFDDSSLTAGLAAIAAYNARYPAVPVTAKLRINAGVGTPAWVIPLAGGPITVANNSGYIQIAAFWTAAYRTQWQALQAHLAAEYDSSPLIGEVAISSCSSRTDEPFIVSLDSTSLSNMRQFGFSDAAEMTCLAGAKDDYAAWVLTPLDFTFNEFRNSDGCGASKPTGCLVQNPAFTIEVMDAFRAALGSGRAVVANHGLQNPPANAAQPVYAEFLNLYNQAQALTPPEDSPLEFQMFSPMVDWDSSIALGLTYHPTEIEVWDTVDAGGHANVGATQLQTYAAQLQASYTPRPVPQLASAARFQTGPVAPDSLVSVFGLNLTGAGGAPAMTVSDSTGAQQNADVLYASPAQLNAVLPATLATGAGSFSISPPGQGSASGAFAVAPVAPGLFSANASGAGVAAAQTITQHADGSVTGDVAYTCPAAASCVAKPIMVDTPGDMVYLVLFGTGFRYRSSLGNTAVSFGALTATPSYAGAQGQFTGLDQINVVVPAALAGSGVVTLTFSADGFLSNALTIEIASPPR